MSTPNIPTNIPPLNSSFLPSNGILLKDTSFKTDSLALWMLGFGTAAALGYTVYNNWGMIQKVDNKIPVTVSAGNGPTPNVSDLLKKVEKKHVAFEDPIKTLTSSDSETSSVVSSLSAGAGNGPTTNVSDLLKKEENQEAEKKHVAFENPIKTLTSGNSETSSVISSLSVDAITQGIYVPAPKEDFSNDFVIEDMPQFKAKLAKFVKDHHDKFLLNQDPIVGEDENTSTVDKETTIFLSRQDSLTEEDLNIFNNLKEPIKNFEEKKFVNLLDLNTTQINNSSLKERLKDLSNEEKEDFFLDLKPNKAQLNNVTNKKPKKKLFNFSLFGK